MVSWLQSSTKLGRDTAIGWQDGHSGQLEGRLVGQRRVAADPEVLLDPALGRQAVVVPAHRVEHRPAAHALEPGDHVGLGVGEGVAEVQRAADRGRQGVDREHLDPGAGAVEAVDAAARPPVGPLALEPVEGRLGRRLRLHEAVSLPAPSVQPQAHDDRVPQLAGAAPVVAAQVALALEPEALVEGDGGGVVGPDLEGELVGAGLAGPVDGLGQQGGADPAARQPAATAMPSSATP